MYDNFFALDQEKKDRIINAAMEEFTTKGYKRASTNEIIKKAGISKGALFHYFKSKLDLYRFLYAHTVHIFMELILPEIERLPKDVMERFSQFALLKMEILSKYPVLFHFAVNIVKEDDKEVQKIIVDTKNDYTSSFMKKIYCDMDTSKFRNDIDITKALQSIWWILEGYSISKQKEVTFEELNNRNSVNEMLKEMNEYLNMLKKSFYKEEYL